MKLFRPPSIFLVAPVLMTLASPLVHAFTCQQRTWYARPDVRVQSTLLEEPSPCCKQRRSILLTGGFASSVFFLHQTESPALAVVAVSSDQEVFKPGVSMGTAEALARFQQAQNDLQYLIIHFDEIVANGGGDNVRRYLGTVGFTSSLYGISKVLKELQIEAEDIVEYTENMNEFDAYLRAADTACYSANFVEYSAAKTKPEAFFKDAFADIQNMKEYMNNMAVELKLNKI